MSSTGIADTPPSRQPRISTTWRILADLVWSILTWLLFYYLRTLIYGYPFSIPAGFYLGLLLYTGGWVLLHFLTGAYSNIYQQSRLYEVLRALYVSLIGSLILLFAFILKNPHGNSRYYYLEFLSLWLPYLAGLLAIRLGFLTRAKNQLRLGQVFFQTLLVEPAGQEPSLLPNLRKWTNETGYRIAAIYQPGAAVDVINDLPQIPDLPTLKSAIRKYPIEEVILAVASGDRALLTQLLQALSDEDVNIKIRPDEVDILSGALKTHNVTGIPLMDIHSGQMPDWQQNLKRAMDLFAAVCGLVILAPLFLYIAWRVWRSSPGPLLFVQERIGYKGRPFRMIKFRSMVPNAEPDGPRLSHDHDPRITPWGKTMRKWRLDELPQLWNILKGEMSLVGPRPERKYYIDQLVQQHPEYKYLLKVKPGLTSWGMVQFGYASTPDEMIQRMPYDLMYVENASLRLDLTILLHSIRIILSGKGK